MRALVVAGTASHFIPFRTNCAARGVLILSTPILEGGGRLAQLGITYVDSVARAIEDLNDGDTYESHTKLYELTITEAWARAVERASTVQEARL